MLPQGKENKAKFKLLHIRLETRTENLRYFWEKSYLFDFVIFFS